MNLYLTDASVVDKAFTVVLGFNYFCFYNIICTRKYHCKYIVRIANIIENAAKLVKAEQAGAALCNNIFSAYNKISVEVGVSVLHIIFQDFSISSRADLVYSCAKSDSVGNIFYNKHDGNKKYHA